MCLKEEKQSSLYIGNSSSRNVPEFISVDRSSLLVCSCSSQCVIGCNVMGRNFKTTVQEVDKDSRELTSEYVASNDVRRLWRRHNNDDVDGSLS